MPSMKSKTRLDSAIFQLTPTRTRCDLFIIANEKKEKIASGLLNPFLAHLKIAQDQIAAGGYSVLLEPNPGSDATWFTKGTVERFVRFVSTPEILERVYTIESEILQIEKAIAIQGNNDMGVEVHQAKPVTRSEGNRLISDGNEKALVLYKPGEHSSEANGSKEEGNSKIQLLKVLETRKTMLQKEQGMAFARAVAAGFDIDHMEPLVLFAECFGALRLMDACFRFTELWKAKHESGQWLEIEPVVAMQGKTDFSAMNASGIVLSSMSNKQHESHNELVSESTEKASMDTKADERHPMDHQVPAGQQDYFHGQFPHPMFPSWPMHSSPGGVPVYQPYPMPGMPYYPNYPGNGPFYPPPYPSGEDSQFNIGHKVGQKRQSMDSREGNSESETWEMDASKIRSQHDLELEDDISHGSGRRKKAGKSGKKQSGMVVIRNINYITSKRPDSSGDESESASDSGTDVETVDLQTDAQNGMHKKSLRSSKRHGNQPNSADGRNLHRNEETRKGKETDGGNWQAFQSYILRGADEDDRAADEGMFAMERSGQIKGRKNNGVDDPLVHGGRDPVGVQDTRISEFQKVNGNMSRTRRSSHDNVLVSRVEGNYGSGERHEVDIQSTEANARRIAYRGAKDDFMIGTHDQSNLGSSLDPLTGNGFEGVTSDLDRTVSHDMADQTYIVPFRSVSLDQAGIGYRHTIDMDSEMPTRCETSDRIDSQVTYEPHDLSLMPERGLEKTSIGYDPAFDYERQFLVEDASLLDKNNKEVVTVSKQGSNSADKDRRSKIRHDNLDKKTGGPIRKGNPSKTNPLEDARARAEKLRSFKADLQKIKKEQEAAEHKRLEALKMERQKRIAARGNSASVQSTLPTRKQLPAKFSPISHRGSKFSDAEPGSSSPLQRSKIRTTSLGSSDSTKKPRATKSSDISHLAGNRLTRSVSSLSETKRESNGVTPDSKASMARIRRLSEPKITSHPATLVKTRSAEPKSKPKVSNGPEKKKVSAFDTEPISKPKISNGPERKKVSAIMNLDRSKAATLPELKIKASKGPSTAQTASAAKEITVKVNELKPNETSETVELYTDKDRLLQGSNENPVVGKTVVMFESEKPSVPAALTSEKLIDERKEYDNILETGEKNKVAEYATIRTAPFPMDGVDRKAIPSRLQEHPSAAEVRPNSAVKEFPKYSSINTAEKPYPTPSAYASSLDNSYPSSLEYGKAPQTSSNSVSAGVGTVKALVSDFNNLKLEKIPEVLEKPQVKESKGIRRLLKFGKKNHSSAGGEQSTESDNGSTYGAKLDDNTVNLGASNDVHILKNLISQDETPTAGSTSQKSSRHFSLLSPFRSKTSEKKLTS